MTVQKLIANVSYSCFLTLTVYMFFYGFTPKKISVDPRAETEKLIGQTYFRGIAWINQTHYLVD